MSRSAQRLNAIAELRALIMQSTISPTMRHGGQPCAATTIASSANGSAKIECANLMESKTSVSR